MRDSQLNTVGVPVLGNENPATLFRAATEVLRILVRNSGGAVLVLSFDAQALATLGVANTYPIPPGQSDVFVLAPKQALFAAAVGVDGQASIAVSVAVPTLRMES